MFIDERLPTRIETGAIRRDEEDIEVTRTDGQWEIRNARHSQSLLEFEISFKTDLYGSAVNAAVKSLYKVARGSLHSFRFRDWSDFALTDANIGTGDGATTAFQIVRKWTVDAETHSRKITRPVSPLVVKKDDVVQVSGYTVDYTTGIVTFTPAPAIGVVITVTGEFDIPVRFDTTMTSVGRSAYNEHLDTLTLVEVRE